MNRKLLSLLAVIPLIGAVFITTSPSVSAQSYRHHSSSCAIAGYPAPPAGYVQTYCHNFVSQGMGDWVTQPGSSAVVSVGRNGLGVGVTALSQWALVISSSAAIPPNSFIQGYVYLAPVNGVIANWPALWTAGPNWPYGGEIDAVEGLGGLACWHTHYPNDPNPGGCAPAGQFTGWHVFTALWTGGTVTFWYDNQKMGLEPLATTATQELIFQNQSYNSQSSCPGCFGPYAASTAYLNWVSVYQKG